MARTRLDRHLCLSGEMTRTEARKAIRDGRVRVDGAVARDVALQIVPDASVVLLDGRPVTGEPYQYVLLHKPTGYLTAARDSRAKTVMELVPDALARRDVLPVGRLDKDTTGLLLLTNDGELAHRLLSPKRHVLKEYHVTLDGPLTQADVDAFAAGVALNDFVAQPARLCVEESAPERSRAVVWLREGKYHQVKRMFHARGREVLALHREAFGSLRLGELPEGESRPLTPGERAALRKEVDLDGE